MTKIFFSKLKEGAKIPQKREEDAGYDIYACFEEEYMYFHPHETKLVPTGIASAFDSDYYFQIFDRGGTGAKGIHCFSGVIDSGFRGEWFIAWHNSNDYPVIINKDKDTSRWNGKDRDTIFYPYTKAIAQAIFLPVPKTEIEEVDYEMLKGFISERGEDMLGSTDKEKTPRELMKDNPFYKYRDKINQDFARIEENLKKNKTIKDITINFIGVVDLIQFKEMMSSYFKASEGIEIDSPFKIGKEYPVISADIEEKTLTLQGEKIYGLFPCTLVLKYNPEIMHLNFY